MCGGVRVCFKRRMYLRIDVGAPGEQQSDHVRVSALDGEGEDAAPALPLDGVHVAAEIQQVAQHVEPPLLHRQVRRRQTWR